MKKQKSLATRLLLHRGKFWYIPMVCILLLAFGVGALGGLEYAGHTQVPAEHLAGEQQLFEGTYAYLEARDVLATFAFNGEAEALPETGDPEDYKFRYVVSQIGDKLIPIKVSKAQNTLLSSAENKLYGTLLPSEPDITEILRNWAVQTIWSRRSEAEIRQDTPELMFYVGYVGYQQEWLGKLLFYVFSGLTVIGVLLVIRSFTLNFKIYDYADYPDGSDFGSHLHIGHNNIWIFMPFSETTVKRIYIEDIVPRNRRVEGGKLKWTLVFVLKQKLYTVPVPSQEVAQAAVDYYKETVRNQATGNFRNNPSGSSKKRR